MDIRNGLISTYNGISASLGTSNAFDIYKSTTGYVKIFNNGRAWFGSGTPVDAGYQMDIVGTARVSGDVVVNNLTLGGGSGQGQVTLGKIFMNYEGLFTYSSAYGLRILPTAANTGAVTIDGGIISLLSGNALDFTKSGKNYLIKKQQGGADARSFLDISGADQTNAGQPGAGGVVRIYGGLNNGVQEQGLLVLAHNGTSTQGSVIVGGTSPSASALLQIDSTTKGVLFPRMTTTQKNAIGTPAAGLVVYDTDTNKLCCYNGTSWNDLF